MIGFITFNPTNVYGESPIAPFGLMRYDGPVPHAGSRLAFNIDGIEVKGTVEYVVYDITSNGDVEVTVYYEVTGATRHLTNAPAP